MCWGTTLLNSAVGAGSPTAEEHAVRIVLQSSTDVGNLRRINRFELSIIRSVLDRRLDSRGCRGAGDRGDSRPPHCGLAASSNGLYSSTGRVFLPDTRGAGVSSASGRFDSDARRTSDCGDAGSRYGTSSLASRVTGMGAIDCPQALVGRARVPGAVSGKPRARRAARAGPGPSRFLAVRLTRGAARKWSVIACGPAGNGS